jgi:hypothetical protein
VQVRALSCGFVARRRHHLDRNAGSRQPCSKRESATFGVPHIERLLFFEPPETIACEHDTEAELLVGEAVATGLCGKEHRSNGERAYVALAMATGVRHSVKQSREHRCSHHCVVFTKRILQQNRWVWGTENAERSRRRKAVRDGLGQADRDRCGPRATRQLFATADVT